jgi:formate-dependent nitrite reductase membrane component NrfD
MPVESDFAPHVTHDLRLPPREGTPPVPRPGEVGAEQPSYYDTAMLKPPTWKWEVASYFFLGGLSAGAYLLSRMAERFGGERYRDVRRAGTAVAALTVLPCAPLLIIDLGDPSRFHHMLRVFKPHSPMNLGAWTLTGYSGAAAAAVLRELRHSGDEAERSRLGKITDGVLLAVTDAAGVPLALLLAGYTGVLLSCTSTPVWSKNLWLGALFSASAMSTGSAAVGLLLEMLGASTEQREAVGLVGSAAHLAEACTLAGYSTQAGSLAAPLTQGKQALPFWGSVAGMAVSEGLKRIAGRGRGGRWLRLASLAAGLAGGYALRWAFVHAGPPSGNDPQAARTMSREHSATRE